MKKRPSKKNTSREGGCARAAEPAATTGYYERMLKEGRERVEALRQDPARYIAALESLLLEAEDVALYRGDWCLCECIDNTGEVYPSQFISDVLTNIRARQRRNNEHVGPA